MSKGNENWADGVHEQRRGWKGHEMEERVLQDRLLQEGVSLPLENHLTV
jgi:hypothetical protein